MHSKNTAKPFLKWAGGKTQLLSQIQQNLPGYLWNEKFTYIEPFVGSGAMLFWMVSTFPNIEKIVINDINADLINTYITIRNTPNELISILEILQSEYYSFEDNILSSKTQVIQFEKVRQNRTIGTIYFSQ